MLAPVRILLDACAPKLAGGGSVQPTHVQREAGHTRPCDSSHRVLGLHF